MTNNKPNIVTFTYKRHENKEQNIIDACGVDPIDILKFTKTFVDAHLKVNNSLKGEIDYSLTTKYLLDNNLIDGQLMYMIVCLGITDLMDKATKSIVETIIKTEGPK